MATYSSTYRRELDPDQARIPPYTRPFHWLTLGWSDVKHAPLASLLIGLGFTLLCVAAYIAMVYMPMFTVALITVLLFVSPFIAASAYYIARQRELNLAPSFHDSLGEVRNHALSIALFSLLSALIVAAWLRLSSIVFALYYSTRSVSAAELARVWTSGGESPAMLMFIMLAGTALAFTLFATGAIALPLVADRNQNVITAIQYGIRTLRENLACMAVWMLVLLTIITLALLSNLILMPVIFPLLAYATWHSYRQLVAGQPLQE